MGSTVSGTVPVLGPSVMSRIEGARSRRGLVRDEEWGGIGWGWGRDTCDWWVGKEERRDVSKRGKNAGGERGRERGSESRPALRADTRRGPGEIWGRSGGDLMGWGATDNDGFIGRFILEVKRGDRKALRYFRT